MARPFCYWELGACGLVTNQTSLTLTNPFADAAGAVFFRLAWVNDAPLHFEYAFDEGYGFTAVTGHLSVALFSSSDAGLWACQDTIFAVVQPRWNTFEVSSVFTD